MKTPSSFVNPYDILGISQAASKAEITKAVASAMKIRRYSVDVIAKAQKSLMNPRKRIVADYMRPILPIIKRFKREDFSDLAMPAPTLLLLPQFDGLDAAIAKAALEESLDSEPLTLTRDYLIKLPDEPKYKLFSSETILPITKLLVLKTVADGQRLIHCEIFTLESENGETIQHIWLLLDEYYPSNTEFLLSINLEREGGDIKVKASLKNDSLATVISLVIAKGSESYVLIKLELMLQELHHYGKLKANEIKAIYAIAKEVFIFLIKIEQYNNSTDEQLELAEKKLQELHTLFSRNHYYQGIEYCQQERYTEAAKSLEAFSQSCSNYQDKDYLQAQMWLVKAYQGSGELSRASELCQKIATNENPQLQTWAKKVFAYLSSTKVANQLPKKQTQANKKTTNLLKSAIQNFQQGNYLETIKLLEEFCKICYNQNDKDYLQAQMTLVKAYHSSRQSEKAIFLCQELTNNNNIKVKNWAQQVLRHLSVSQVNQIKPSLSPQPKK